MGTRKPKKPEKKGFLGGLLAGFGIGKKTGKKKAGGKGGKGTGARKGAVPARKPKPVETAAVDDFDFDLDGMQPSAPGGFSQGTGSFAQGGYSQAEDDLFAGLEFETHPPDMSGMLPPQPPAAPQGYAEQRVPHAPAPQSAPAPAADDGKLFPGGVDASLDDLFDSFELGGGTPAAPASPLPSMPASPAAAAPPMPPQPHAPHAPAGAPTQPFMTQGVAMPQAPAAAAPPAPPRPQPTPPQPPAGDGLVSIGKLLVDQNTLKRIIDNAEKRGANLYATTRVITESRGQDLDGILQTIDRCGGVAGSLIVGRDGLVIASTLPAEFDKEMIGAIASSMQTNLDVQCKKMKLGTARQIIVDTEGGVLLLMALEVGVLVVLSASLMQLDLAAVLQAIASASERA